MKTVITRIQIASNGYVTMHKVQRGSFDFPIPTTHYTPWEAAYLAYDNLCQSNGLTLTHVGSDGTVEFGPAA